MALVFLGTDFHDTALGDLESLVALAPRVQDALDPAALPALSGAVVLATCNRFELYVDIELESFHDSVDAILAAVTTAAELPAESLAGTLAVLTGDSVSQHLFSVACGLESMVIGEEEIAGQVKRAWGHARRRNRSSKALNALFQRAATVSKAVSSSTGLGASGRSVISTALEIAGDRIGGLAGRRALIIGTGAYSRVVTAALKRADVSEILVFSPSGRAELFSASHATTPVAKADLLPALTEVDIVVSASGGQTTIIDRELARTAISQRNTNEFIMVDVALSRDIDPLVAELAGVHLIDLEHVRSHTPSAHVEAVATARTLVRNAVAEFRALLAGHSVDPVISALRSHVGHWVRDEVDQVRRRSGDATADEVERSLRKVTNALLHSPSVKAKSLAAQGDPGEYIAAVRLLFDIEVEQRA